jgi:hypothetical protein|tara:strand:- start:342 stop:596 length:255 start_codon:yes stop_codon:yes gene_type:complete
MPKIIISIFFLLLLNGCIQNTVFLGPVLTGASTGSAYQAGLSYGSGRVVSSLTGKTTAENIKVLFKEKDKKINERSGVKNLANQ